MTNTFITQKTGPVARAALGLLHLSTVLPQLCYRDGSVDGNVAEGDTINVKLPASFTAGTYVRSNGLTIQAATQTKIPVVFDTLTDVSMALTAEELTQELNDFNANITRPAMAAIAETAEAKIAAAVAAISDYPLDVASVADFIEAVMVLTSNKAPMGGRYAVLGTTLATTLLSTDNLLKVDQAGNGDALREAKIGRLAGCDVYVSPYVSATEGFISAVDGIGFFSRAIAAPMGAAFSASDSFEGVAIRTVFDYDVDKKQDICSFDSLMAAKVLDENRVQKISTNGS